MAISVSADFASNIRHGLRSTDWVATDLWIAAVGLGGSFLLKDVHSIISGEHEPTRPEHNVLAHALNERFMELGRHQPMTYCFGPPKV